MKNENQNKQEGDKKSFDFSKIYPLFFTIIFVVLLFQYSFSTLEAIFFDLRVRTDFGINYKDNVVLITMDEESDQFLGENYPYTYASHTRLFDKLKLDKPKVVGYLVSLLEPESERDQKHMLEFQNSLREYTNSGGKFRFGTQMDKWNEQVPPRELQKFGYSLALMNIDNAAFAKDDVCRRAILSISGEDTFHLWMANEFRKQNGKDPLGLNNILGSYYVRKADANFTLFRYYSSPTETKGKVKRIPFHRVLVGNFPKGFFTDKIVLVGTNYVSNASDFILTPFNKEEYKSPKIIVHAQIIQSLLQNKTILGIPKWVSYTLSIFIAILLSVTISRVKPPHSLIFTIILLVGIIFTSWLLFSIFGLWLYVTHLVLTVFVVFYIWVPFRAIGEYQTRFAFQEEAKLMKKVDNLKQNFISLMSHDLKTPVAKIAGLADITLAQNLMGEGLKKNLNSIIEATKELNRFITSILDLTKVESRNITLNKVSKDINPIIENIVETLRFEAARKNTQVSLSLSPLYPIEFDVTLINRGIGNLVENAIKYSGEDATIEIKTWDDEKWVYVEIKDNGVGIPPADLAHIFDKFYRVKNDASHSIKGSGLGLYLVKYFVELHGGNITADSSLGQGTKFQIRLINQ